MFSTDNEILNFPFKIKQNKYKFRISVDLRLVRKYNNLAELEAQLREEHILETGEIFMHPLDNDNAYLIEEFEMDVFITDFIELENFKNQRKKLAKLKLDPSHYANLICLAQQSNKYEAELFKDHQVKFDNIRKHIQFLLDLAYQQNDNKSDTSEISIYTAKGQLKNKISLNDSLTKSVIEILIEHYRKELLNLYLPLINDALDENLTEDTIRYSDLERIISNLDKYVKSNSELAAQEYLRKTLLTYIRDNRVFKSTLKSTSMPDYPNSNEARLIYFILCVTGQRPIMLPDLNIEKPWDGNVNNQNDRIINGIIKQYKKPAKSIFSSAPNDSKIFELYMPFFS